MGLLGSVLGAVAKGAIEVIASSGNDGGCSWYCDRCGAYMNDQDGFTVEDGDWECEECGYHNDVTPENVIDGSTESVTLKESDWDDDDDDDLPWSNL